MMFKCLRSKRVTHSGKEWRELGNEVLGLRPSILSLLDVCPDVLECSVGENDQ